jgi:hypothetical protein
LTLEATDSKQAQFHATWNGSTAKVGGR